MIDPNSWEAQRTVFPEPTPAEKKRLDDERSKAFTKALLKLPRPTWPPRDAAIEQLKRRVAAVRGGG